VVFGFLDVRRGAVGLFPGVVLTLAAVALGGGPSSADPSPQQAEPPPNESLFDDFDDTQGYPTPETLRQLLAPVPGVRADVARANKWERRICRISGLFRLIPPWPAGSSLRLSILDPERLQVHLWSGAQGVTVRYYPEYHQTWALYATTREGSKPRPDKYVLGATAGDRYRRAGVGTVQLQYQGGNLLLTRGDLLLGSVPLAGPPGEVYVEGGGMVRGLAVRGSQWLPSQPERASASRGTARSVPGTSTPDAVRVLRPADWSWETSLPDGVTLKKLPSGGVTLGAGEKAQQGQAAIAIDNPGFAEYLFDVEDPDPGTGVFLGDRQGKHIARLGFFRHRETGQVAFDLLPIYSSETEKSYDVQRQVAPLVGRRQWYRIVAGAGMFTAWASLDGIHWSQTGPVSLDGEGACGQVGLYCLPGQKKRSITLRSLEVRPLEALRAAAPAEAQKQVENLSKLDSLAKWEDAVAGSAPANVPADVWWRACAVRTLCDGPKPTLAQPLLDRLQRAVYESSADADYCLRFAEEASMFYPGGDWASMDRLTSHVKPLGMALVRNRHPAPLTALERSMMNWPLWHHRRLPVYPDELLRHELVSRLGEGRWGEVHDLCRRLEYFNRTGGPREGEQPPWSPHAEYLVQWADAVAAQYLPKPKDAKPAPRRTPLARHPLIENPTREGFSAMSELRAALDNQSYREAAQIVTSTANCDRLGLLPDRDDPWLSTSFPVMVGLAVRDRPALGKSIQEVSAAVGQLRLRQATGAGSPAGVEAVGYQFRGTELAAAAYRWLGDRELSMGRPVEAFAQYRKSYPSASPAEREVLLLRARLLGALEGRDVGRPPKTAVQFGGRQFSPTEFEQMIDGLRQARAKSRESRVESAESRVESQGSSSQLSTLDSRLSTFAVRAGRFEPRYFARVEGGDVKRPSGYPDRGVDWAGRQTAAVVAEGRMIVNNRIEQTAFGLATGKVLWANRLGVEEGKQQWASLAIRPVVTAGEVYCRRLTNAGLELVALDSADGRLLWQARPDDAVVSDPLFVGQRLFVLSATADPGSKIAVSLVGLDIETGRVRSRTPLAEFRDVWRGRLPCQATVLEEKIVATVGGCVLCCDVWGRVHWLRRQVWIPPSSSEYWNGREWIDQCYSLPLVAEGLVFATQPGVWAVECMELDSGRLRWRQALGGLVGLLGQAKGRLIAETGDGLVGLDPDSGRVVWSLDLRDRLDTVLCGPQGPVLSVHLGPKKDGNAPAPIWLTWTDPQTGRRLGRSVFKPPSSGEAWLKPVIAAEGRLWAFWAPLQEPAKREILELVRVGEPEEGPEGE
jgi:outer membrane protein assembly factor BamB